ncbi:MAG: gamma-glutamyltransferase, partial [Ponticaulis sp.]|nr:gamma-glutamyltransferase [Ponticaulis sp.]
MPEAIAPRQGMVTSPHYLASEAGLGVLKDGGNAVEACVAVAAALAVVYPHMTSIGGDGFWLVHEPDGTVYSVNACGAAGRNVSIDLYEAEGYANIPWRGPLAAITVAGTVSGWEKALATSGSTLPLARILRDAIQYAEDGIPITKGGAAIAAAKDAELSPVFGYSEIFRPNDTPLKEGDKLKQVALAETLRKLAENGLSDFYTGALADELIADLKDAGSSLTKEDFLSHRAEKLAPLKARVREADLYNTAPPTQGFTSLLILSLFDRLEPKIAESFEHVHTLIEATK